MLVANKYYQIIVTPFFYVVCPSCLAFLFCVTPPLFQIPPVSTIWHLEFYI